MEVKRIFGMVMMALMCCVTQAQVSEEDVWNISEQEAPSMKAIELAWFGNYAGSNSLGMVAFAEAFDAPEQESSITAVKVYFAKTATMTPEADITVSIVLPDNSGEPAGDVLATATVKASELVSNAGKTGTDIIPTVFTFDNAPIVSSSYFVTISGFPNSYDDDIAIACVRRNNGELCTAWHYLEVEDANYQPTGEYQWYLNTDDPTTLGVAVHLQWGSEEQEDPTKVEDLKDSMSGALKSGVYYNLAGRQVGNNYRGIIIKNGVKSIQK